MLNDKNFINIVFEIAKGSKCVSRQVGAIIVKNNRILSTGYNGTPSGYENCKDHFNGIYTSEHHDWSAKYEIHAEMNAILWAARNGVSIEGATVYCTYEPCYECTKNIIGAGIKHIIYKDKYKHYTGTEAEEFIIKNGCTTKQYIVN